MFKIYSTRTYLPAHISDENKMTQKTRLSQILYICTRKICGNNVLAFMIGLPELKLSSLDLDFYFTAT